MTRALAAGASGRDREKVQRHIDHLGTLGVKPPPHVPMLYPLLPTLVTNATDIAVIGTDSTPEIEVVLFRTGGVDYLTVGSDHTDRRIEAASALQGKNSCPKIVATTAWRVGDVRDHWDALTLHCRGGETLLQEGSLAHVMTYDDLMAFVNEHDGDQPEGRLVFSGTVPTQARPPPGDVTIGLELADPVLLRSLTHSYRVHVRHEYFPAGP
ncbi:MAG TPA: DUF2848 family protein [Candidatus Methylomirabilis sp.]|nr:DUF2848 family protein [Candidatus Methylomirabilis sp.]